jgi:glutathione synthase/RimK-type ligase-like ATP-grasp enzyme
MNVLIFATGNLMGIARLPKALQQNGFNVSILCSQDSYISKTRFTDRRFFLKSIKQNLRFIPTAIAVLVNAITTSAAKFIFPGDERAVYILHYIVRQSLNGNANLVPSDVLEIIRFSLGDPAFFEATNNKNFAQKTAREIGIKVPKQLEVEDDDESKTLDFANSLGYPVALKKGMGEAGHGVKVCQNEQELVKSLNMPLFAKPSSLKLLIRRLLGRDTVWIPNSAAFAVQQFISGTPAIYNVVAIAGETLAGYAGIKEGINRTGQTTRIRLIEHPEMAAAASSFMRHLKYTGFADLDFMIDKNGTPYFLECNPRPTPLSALGRSLGVDLCEALMAGLTNKKFTPRSSSNSDRLITLFPQEWLRDPQSPHLESVDHDVPWDDPELVRAYING